jgi:hypothetical protein
MTRLRKTNRRTGRGPSLPTFQPCFYFGGSGKPWRCPQGFRLPREQGWSMAPAVQKNRQAPERERNRRFWSAQAMLAPWSMSSWPEKHSLSGVVMAPYSPSLKPWVMIKPWPIPRLTDHGLFVPSVSSIPFAPASPCEKHLRIAGFPPKNIPV